MSIDIESTRNENQIKHIYKRKTMTIVEEEEIITSEIHERPEVKIEVHHMMPISHIEVAHLPEEEKQPTEDFWEREELARIIGLAMVPKPTVDAIDEIFGMFDSIAQGDQVDVVKMIKALRKRC